VTPALLNQLSLSLVHRILFKPIRMGLILSLNWTKATETPSTTSLLTTCPTTDGRWQQAKVFSELTLCTRAWWRLTLPSNQRLKNNLAVWANATISIGSSILTTRFHPPENCAKGPLSRRNVLLLARWATSLLTKPWALNLMKDSSLTKIKIFQRTSTTLSAVTRWFLSFWDNQAAWAVLWSSLSHRPLQICSRACLSVK